VDEVGIGEFARRSRLSVKALRLYDELSVLLPARVDQDSGYRYYDLAQLETAFVAILRDRPLPRLAGREGATFCVYWGQVSADSDGPVEWCKPVPVAEGKALAAQYPELNLRTEPAHSSPISCSTASHSSRRRRVRFASPPAPVRSPATSPPR